MRIRSSKRKRLWQLAAAALPLALLAAAATAAIEKADVAPRVLAGYMARRAEGHSRLITVPVGWVSRLLLQADWTATRGDVPEYPIWTGAIRRDRDEIQSATRTVASPQTLLEALKDARPGERIELLPGEYEFSGTSIDVAREGSADAPITLAARQLGDVTLKFRLLEGFHVHAPYWKFENLIIDGICDADSDCEHAFHIVGPARGTVIRNNVLRDFNAQIKINGDARIFPDGGLIESNTLIDRHGRRTDNPVTPIDLVAASNWNIAHNLIADFIKLEGDGISYGAFVKGAGEANRFDGNVVLCNYRLRGTPGKTVGLSLGGGGSRGTDPSMCRDRQCAIEQDAGVLRNNLVAFCSDDGLYLNRASRSQVVHNTVLDTAGLTARWSETSAHFAGNLLDGTVRVIDGAMVHDDGNRSSARLLAFVGLHPIRSLFRDVAQLDLRWAAGPPAGAPPAAGEVDLCGSPRPISSTFGAFTDITPCLTH